MDTCPKAEKKWKTQFLLTPHYTKPCLQIVVEMAQDFTHLRIPQGNFAITSSLICNPRWQVVRRDIWLPINLNVEVAQDVRVFLLRRREKWHNSCSWCRCQGYFPPEVPLPNYLDLDSFCFQDQREVFGMIPFQEAIWIGTLSNSQVWQKNERGHVHQPPYQEHWGL